MKLPQARELRRTVLADFGIPEEVVAHMALKPQFDTRDTERALAGTDIKVPELHTYAEKLWDFWERKLDPDLYKDRSFAHLINGRTVVITGASSGIGRATALKVAAAGGIPLLVARGMEKLEALRAEIEALDAPVYDEVNNGVYKAGFATSQETYEQAYDARFAQLHQLDQHLETERYLVGRTLTEADVRLFTTLVRFDAAYHGHFKCNERKLTEFANLWPYARDLFQTPGFGDTTDFDHIKRHYYGTHDKINPTRVVPKGPDLSGWDEPHGRDHLGD